MYAGSLHPVHSSIGPGKGWPLITTFDSDTNTIFIALIVLENNVQLSTQDVADMMRRYSNAVLCCHDYALALIALCTALSASRCRGRVHEHRLVPISSFVIVLSVMLASDWSSREGISGCIDPAFTCINGWVGGWCVCHWGRVPA